MDEQLSAGMIVDGAAINLERHLARAFKEHANTLGKAANELTNQERVQALCGYILAGKHLTGAGEGDE